MSRLRLTALAVSILSSAAAQTSLRVAERAGAKHLEFLSGSAVIAESAPEGLWSVACEWRDRWPAAWHSAHPSSVSTNGNWTILKGELKACGGAWLLEDAYRPSGRALHAVRRFTWQGPGAAPTATLSIRLRVPTRSAQLLLPGIVYYGNPSGARSGKVPVWTGAAGDELLFEEHRYPMPFAYAELRGAAGFSGAALHSIPSLAPFANKPDQWWSLGAIARGGAVELTLLSGPCATNGRRSAVKAYQSELAPYPDAWLNLPAGAVVEKSFLVEVFPVDAEGNGFRRPMETSLAWFAPDSMNGLPPVARIIRDKWRYAKTRWVSDAAATGFRKYSDRPVIVMGWTGQAEAPGYALPVLAAGLGDPEARAMAHRSLDFLAGAQFYEGGFHNWFEPAGRGWHNTEILNQGQAMLAFARAIALGRKEGVDTTRWETFLRRAADLHARRILDAAWRPPSTSEITFVAPLLHSFRLFGADHYRDAALKAATHYAARHLSMREPYWGGTLDAQCEDKEAASAAFQAFLELFEFSGDQQHLTWARHAAAVALTYMVVWDIDLPPGRLRDLNFKTRGWTVVSPQNQHLDIWGAIMAPDYFRLGQIDRRLEVQRLALLLYRTCGQIIDPAGSQGEQMHHTNYIQRPRGAGLNEYRGGYNERHTVFWITAHFLTGAARLAELGYPIWADDEPPQPR